MVKVKALHGLRLRREKAGRGFVCKCPKMLASGEPNFQRLMCGDVFPLSVSDGKKNESSDYHGRIILAPHVDKL